MDGQLSFWDGPPAAYMIRVRSAPDGRAYVDVWTYDHPQVIDADDVGDLMRAVLPWAELRNHLSEIGTVIAHTQPRGWSARHS